VLHEAFDMDFMLCRVDVGYRAVVTIVAVFRRDETRLFY
jgi:hypothetical protein